MILPIPGYGIVGYGEACVRPAGPPPPPPGAPSPLANPWAAEHNRSVSIIEENF